MQYFVSIENTPYFHWQVDLLIESFKMANLEDKLVISVANNQDNFRFKTYGKNLDVHQPSFSHDNFGKELGYLPLNKIRAIAAAMEHKILAQPFAVIHSDMVLREPIKVDGKSTFYFDTCVEPDAETKWTVLEPRITQIIQNFGLTREAAAKWLPLGDILVFQAMPENFVYRWLERTMEIVREKHVTAFSPEKDGLILALYDFLGRNLFYQGKPFQSNLLERNASNFIHFKHGIPPVFNKRNYLHLGSGLAGDDPLDIILSHNPTPNTDWLQKVVKSYFLMNDN